jgi:hypothetical protein
MLPNAGPVPTGPQGIPPSPIAPTSAPIPNAPTPAPVAIPAMRKTNQTSPVPAPMAGVPANMQAIPQLPRLPMSNDNVRQQPSAIGNDNSPNAPIGYLQQQLMAREALKHFQQPRPVMPDPIQAAPRPQPAPQPQPAPDPILSAPKSEQTSAPKEQEYFNHKGMDFIMPPADKVDNPAAYKAKIKRNQNRIITGLERWKVGAQPETIAAIDSSTRDLRDTRNKADANEVIKDILSKSNPKDRSKIMKTVPDLLSIWSKEE